MPSHQGWVQTLEPIPVANQTTIAVLNEGALWADQYGLVPANWLIPGTRFAVYAQGQITTPASNNGPIVIRLRYSTAGNPTGGVSLAARNTLPSLANSVSNGTWDAQFNGVCRADGTSGTVWCTGRFTTELAFASFASYQSSIQIPSSSPAVATIDTTLTKILVMTASGSSSSCSMTCSQVQISTWN